MAHFAGLRRHLRRRRGDLPRRAASARSSKLQLTDDGVDVYLDIDKSYDTIPADTLAVVGNRSAVGEQYVELQPQTDNGPYLRRLEDRAGRTPDPDRRPRLLTHLDRHRRVGRPGRAEDHRRPSSGEAFNGTGQDLQRIIDTGNSFINPPTTTSTSPRP